MSVNPVLRALERAKLDAQLAKWERNEAELRATIARRLGGDLPPSNRADSEGVIGSFRAWCEQNGVRDFPAQPATLAQFVLEHASVGIENLAATIGAISQSYFVRGLPNPVATWMVATAMERVGDRAPPRSWPKGLKAEFSLLPRTLKQYVADHDAQREKVLRRAQNEAAQARRAVAEVRAEARSDEAITGDLDDKSNP